MRVRLDDLTYQTSVRCEGSKKDGDDWVGIKFMSAEVCMRQETLLLLKPCFVGMAGTLVFGQNVIVEVITHLSIIPCEKLPPPPSVLSGVASRNQCCSKRTLASGTFDCAACP